MWKALLYFALLMFPHTSYACTPTTGYRVPTNIELIDEADLVVLARVKPAPERSGEASPSNVVLETIRSLKGDAPGTVTLMGTILERRGGKPYPLEPTPLSTPHRSVLWGGCVRQAYHAGGLVVAVLKKTQTGFGIAGGPFARAVEDVQDANALWARTAELYVRILSTNSPSNRRNAFAAERRRLMRKAGDPDAQAVAEDIQKYLKASARQ